MTAPNLAAGGKFSQTNVWGKAWVMLGFGAIGGRFRLVPERRDPILTVPCCGGRTSTGTNRPTSIPATIVRPSTR